MLINSLHLYTSTTITMNYTAPLSIDFPHFVLSSRPRRPDGDNDEHISKKHSIRNELGKGKEKAAHEPFTCRTSDPFYPDSESIRLIKKNRAPHPQLCAYCLRRWALLPLIVVHKLTALVSSLNAFFPLGWLPSCCGLALPLSCESHKRRFCGTPSLAKT
jgi:hypothetical protein